MESRVGNRLLSAAVAGICLAAASLALGAEARSALSASEKFRMLDANRDGYLSRAELRRYPDYLEAFDSADANHDGRLDPDEFIKAEAIVERLEAARYLDDSVITARVKAALLKEPKLKSLDVSVQTWRGHVLLSGFVESEAQRSRALQTAASVDGVVDVKDAMVVMK